MKPDTHTRAKRPAALDPQIPDCPIRNVLARICDKWSLLVLHTLAQEGVMRFSSLRRCIPDISQKMLTATLRTLEADGYIHRTVYAEVPPRVEYTLTSLAHSLLPLVGALEKWAVAHMDTIQRHRQQYRPSALLH